MNKHFEYGDLFKKLDSQLETLKCTSNSYMTELMSSKRVPSLSRPAGPSQKSSENHPKKSFLNQIQKLKTRNVSPDLRRVFGGLFHLV